MVILLILVYTDAVAGRDIDKVQTRSHKAGYERNSNPAAGVGVLRLTEWRTEG